MCKQGFHEKLPVVIFYSRRIPSYRGVLVETLASLLGILEKNQTRLLTKNYFSFLNRNSYDSLSYISDWLTAFSINDELEVSAYNISDIREFYKGLKHSNNIPLTVILHSAAGDNMSILNMASSWFKSRKGMIMLFFGNEYNHMKDKITFAKAIEADFIASQLPTTTASWLYEDCVKSRIIYAPPALNPDAYQSHKNKRSIDIGFRGSLYPYYIGDNERTDVLEYFRTQGIKYDLNVDIRYERMSGSAWSKFLNNCKGIVGAESGTYYIEKDDKTINAVTDYLSRYSDVKFEDIYDKFFKNLCPAVSGKAISSRHFEPIGTKTCQILLEGEYNGILKPDLHYISLKKNLTNISDVVERFKDANYRIGIIERAYLDIIENHTYKHRVNKLINEFKEHCNGYS